MVSFQIPPWFMMKVKLFSCYRFTTILSMLTFEFLPCHPILTIRLPFVWDIESGEILDTKRNLELKV
ncbi:hypothetical protein DNHGIG_21190 [Collibacillus ludicampi]|uniref:Uncharacterized protein n=1 Tax=Collibacillus ludicampi TaxID=2771369 RepID=A0AAV4LFG4_9BACL|nr:hypothetical protein DNHGIG_21190 [Collibacillus ludicampi]